MPEARPLAHLEVCTTGVDNKIFDSLIAAIKALGGQFVHNLNRNTNVLIVGKRWSEKYNFSMRERPDIKFYSPEFILELHTQWLAGEPVNYAKMLDEKTLPTFSGLKICLTQVSPSDKKIYQNLIENASGQFTGALTRVVDILVSTENQGRKVEHAKLWEIKTVHPHWVTDSVKSGAAIDPSLYLLELPVDKRGMGVPRTRGPGTFKEPTRPKTASSVLDAPLSLRQKRKTSGQWDSMMAPPTKTRSMLPRVSAELALRPTFETANSTSLNLNGSSSTKVNAQIFEGLSFELKGFDKRQTSVLTRALDSNGGRVDNVDPDYVVIHSEHPEVTSVTYHRKVVTEWAVERSLHYKRCMLDDIWCKPVRKQNIKAFSGLQICLSGYTGVEILHLGRLIKLLGANYVETLTADRDILIAPATNARKFGYAKDWGIPVISEQWLWDCANAGELLDFADAHAIDGLGARPAPRNTKPATPVSLSPAKRAVTEATESSESSSMGRLDDIGSQVLFLDESASEKFQLLHAMGESGPAIEKTYPQTMPAVNTKRARPRLR